MDGGAVLTPAPPFPQPLPASAEDAVEALHVAIAERPRWTVPCRAAADPAPWTSDDEQDTAWAAEECLACPLLAECERFGVATRAQGVVLAGRRWTPHTAKNLAARGGTTTSPATAGATERKCAS